MSYGVEDAALAVTEALPAAAWRGRLSVDVKRYVRVKATTADASPQVPVGDCSGKSVSAGLVF